MRIDKLEITNFKNFEFLSEDFVPGVNIFLGNNGSGKTSILEAINVALGGFFGNQEPKTRRMIDINEVKIDTFENNPKRANKTIIKANSAIIAKEWSISFNSITKKNDTSNAKLAAEYGQKIIDSFETTEHRIIAPLIVYYSTQRIYKDVNKSHKQEYDALSGRRNGYLQWSKENSIKNILSEWLAIAVTSRATKQIKEIGQTDLILENVEHAIKNTLISFLDLNDNLSLKIYQEPYFDNELFVFYDNEHNLPLSNYSDGFRNIIFLVIDLIWRASQLNPWLNLTEITKQVTGVVTIDEIDLHLHPKWQAKAIGLLQELLPHVQFFITTHSPTVLANFNERKDESGKNLDIVFILDNNKTWRIDTTFFGRDINSVLYNLMGADIRAIEILDLLSKFYCIAENPNSTDEEYTTLNDTSNKLKEYLPGTDKEIIRINDILEHLQNK